MSKYQETFSVGDVVWYHGRFTDNHGGLWRVIEVGPWEGYDIERIVPPGMTLAEPLKSKLYNAQPGSLTKFSPDHLVPFRPGFYRKTGTDQIIRADDMRDFINEGHNPAEWHRIEVKAAD